MIKPEVKFMPNNQMKHIKLLIFITIFALLLPIGLSNGGCIKIADDIFVQLSSSTSAPVVNKEVSYLISFGDKNGLIMDEINGTLRIMQSDSVILKKDFKIKDGVLDLKHTFKNQGLYEIFLEFNIGKKTYMPEDFLIEVINQKNDFFDKIIFLLIGIAIGFVLALVVRLRKK